MLSFITIRLLSIQTIQYSIYKYILHCILDAIHHNYKSAINTDSTVQYSTVYISTYHTVFSMLFFITIRLLSIQTVQYRYISLYTTVFSMLSTMTIRPLSIQTVQYSIYKYLPHCILYAIHHNYKTAFNTDSTVQYSTVYISTYHTVFSMLSTITIRLLSIQTVQYSTVQYI